MKKLICALVLLAMLVPVAAMAAKLEIPNPLTGLETVGYSLSFSRGGLRKTISGHLSNNDEYTARYYFSGALESYTYMFAECGCEIDYNPFGEKMDSQIRRKINGSVRAFWDDELGEWEWMGEPKNDGHTPAEHIANPPVTPQQNVAGKIPPDTAQAVVTSGSYSTYEDLKNAALNTFAENLEDEEESNIIAQETKTKDKVTYNLALVKKDNMYGRYTNGKFVETYIDSLVINKDEEQCWFGGDAGYGINTEGFYDWESGKLAMYKFYSADRSMNAMYSVKNVLLSTELWDSKGGYWGFNTDVVNKWVYNASGDFRDAKEKAPTPEVLEKILHAPEPAKYESACVTSERELDEDQKGVPYIIANESDINNATVITEATQSKENLRATIFDITLKDANGKKVGLAADSVTLTLGYPAGMPQNVSKNFAFAVIHELDDGTEEVMTTLTDSVKLTANGPQVTATGFSPYTVIWGTPEEVAEYADLDLSANISGDLADLPQTGDSSNLLAYACLLLVSAAALYMLGKRRAHR